MKGFISKFRNDVFSRRYAPHQSDAPILNLSEIQVGYESGKALDGISFRLLPGDGVALVGPNGAGKTTLFKVIAGILEPDRGSVQVSGHEPGGHTCIAYVPQRSQVDWSFPATVADVAMMGRINKWDHSYGPRQWIGKSSISLWIL
jgi:ABC-type Mn2+/Zn2+ transport system ATPase subunit